MTVAATVWLAGIDLLEQQIAVLDADGVIVNCNSAWRSHAQAHAPDASSWQLGSPFAKTFLSPAYSNAARSSAATVLRAAQATPGQTQSATYRFDDPASPRWYRLSFRQYAVEERDFVLVTHEDISAHRRQESDPREELVEAQLQAALEVNITASVLGAERLAHEHELLNLIVNSVPHLIVWKDCDLNFLGCNEQYARMAGLDSPPYAVGRTVAQLPFIADHSERYDRIDRQILATGTPALRLRETWRLANGDDRVVMMNRMPLRRRDQTITGILSVSEDVTESERATQKIREDEERWTLALEVNDVGVWDYDALAARVVGSRRWSELLSGKTCLQPVEIPLPAELIYADELPRFMASWRALLSGVLPALESGVRLLVGDCYRYMRVRGRVVRRDASGKALRVIGTIVDIHEAMLRQAQAANASKLESIGQLAAGIAHEINTPTQYVGDNVRFLGDAFASVHKCIDDLTALTAPGGESVSAISVRASLSRVDMPYLCEEIPKAIAQSLEGIQRIAKIVGAMKEFSHPGHDLTPTDLNHAITNTIAVATNEWKYVATIATDMDATLPPVPVIPGEFNQVILNIIVNAAQAIAAAHLADSTGKGTIHIVTCHSAQWAEVRISDDGCGMPRHVQERIFDPFFTTKPVGKGTGQGLSIAHHVIVEKHRGTISVSSEVDRGTTFTIRIPLTLEERVERAA